MSAAPSKNGLVAFPSVSRSLHSLPGATSMNNVSLHPNMYAQRAKESEAKLQHAFTKPILNPNAPMPYQQQGKPAAAPLMMRTPVPKIKIACARRRRACPLSAQLFASARIHVRLASPRLCTRTAHSTHTLLARTHALCRAVPSRAAARTSSPAPAPESSRCRPAPP
ncbi:hypothetical protein B0H15DRAFT_953484 [Mycena belliarum]|uniref:Uncharacterized protein n=1 Tax=Mycena belliarum TaxID=1033014 RepID=A0AAD6U0H1_9AGAR|nr:hypothetical protein B0H15DRAFT_953484 [Mycena belliae]